MSAEPISLSEQLDRAKTDLVAIRRRTDTAATLTLLVGVLMLAALCAYFYIGYRAFNEFTEPDTMVGLAASLLDEQVPEVRRALERQLIDQAPLWAESLSSQAIAGMPAARQRFEVFVSEGIDSTLEQGTDLSEAQFRAFLHENRDSLRADMEQLAASPELAEQQLDALQTALESQIQLDLRSQFRELFQSLVLLNEKLSRLRAASDLTEEEQRELRLLKLARRLHQRGMASPTLTDSRTTRSEGIPAIKTATTAVLETDDATAKPTEPVDSNE